MYYMEYIDIYKACLSAEPGNCRTGGKIKARAGSHLRSGRKQGRHRHPFPSMPVIQTGEKGAQALCGHPFELTGEGYAILFHRRPAGIRKR